MLSYLLVGIGGALGAMGRFGVGRLVGSLHNGFPLSTLVVNVVGSLAMGAFVGIMARAMPQHSSDIHLFVAVGMFGGFTTFSTFSLDTITLIEGGNLLLATVYIVVSVLLSLAGLWLGLLAIRALA